MVRARWAQGAAENRPGGEVVIDSEDYPRPFDLEGFLRDGYLPGFAGDWLDPADIVADAGPGYGVTIKGRDAGTDRGDP